MDNLKYESLSDSVSIAQDSRGLLLTTDACLLSAFVNRNAKQNICELGAGSGIISAMLLLNKKIKSSVCVDFQPDICELALNNAVKNGLADKMAVVCSDVLLYKTEKKYDAVVSNPPYFKSGDGRKNERDQDRLSRHESTATIADFASCASRIIKDGGIAYFCYTPGRLSELLSAMTSAGLEPKKLITVYPTVKHKPSLVLVSAKKGAESGIELTRPLIIYKDRPGGELTEDYIRIKTENRIEL